MRTTLQSDIPVTMRISPELDGLLESLAHKHRTTKTEIISRAFALLDVAHTATSQAKRIGILDQDSHFEEIEGI